MSPAHKPPLKHIFAAAMTAIIVVLGAISLPLSPSSLFPSTGSSAINSDWSYPITKQAFAVSSPIGSGDNSQLAVDGTNIYSVWEEGGDITFAKSEDSGGIFVTTTLTSSGDAHSPQLAVDGTSYYVVWEEVGDITFATCVDVPLVGCTFLTTTLTSSGDAHSPQLAVDGTNIYVVWEEGGDITFAKSTDSGVSFLDPLVISATTSTTPQLAVDGTNIYVVWEESGDITFAKSEDSGDSFGDPPITFNTDDVSISPDVATISGSVLVIWQEVGFSSSQIFLAKSSDNGANFDASINVSNSGVNNLGTTVSAINPSIGYSGTDLFISWEESDSTNSIGRIFVLPITDSGATIGCGTVVGTTTDFDSTHPQISGDGISVHAVWEDGGSVMLDIDTTYQAPYVSITAITGNQPAKWGLDADETTVSGQIANVGTDVPIVDWGGADGTTDITDITGCTWSASHVYTIDSVGQNSITASLPTISSESFLIDVISHTTTLILDPIPSVKLAADLLSGADLTVTGILYDNDTETGAIEGIPISFDGTGTDLTTLIDGAVTNADGTFTAISVPPLLVDNRWEVQAHYFGDIPAYNADDSDIMYYNTVDTLASEFDVLAGEDVTVELTGFNANVTFGNVASDGKVYASSCSPSDADRFLALGEGSCLIISPGAALEPGSINTLSMLFDESTIPDGYDSEDIDLFLELASDGSSFTDLTKERIAASSITIAEIGSSSPGFGEFIAGAAVHDISVPENQQFQLFLGDDNQVMLRDVSYSENVTATITLDKSSYLITDTAAIAIVDKNADLNPTKIDEVSAGLTTEASGLGGGITITLTETGPATGNFTGTFTFTVGDSSGDALKALAGVSNTVSVSYQVVLGVRFSATVNDVTEAGLAEASDFTIDADTTPFNDVGYAVDLNFLDAQLGPGADVVVILSYANADLAESDELFLRLFKGEKLEDGSINWLADPINEIDGLTQESSDVDTAAKTLSAHTSSDGIFVLGYEVGNPGGAGGGLGLPGSGVVVDFVATIAISSGDDGGSGDGDSDAGTSGGGGGGGGSSSSSTSSSSSSLKVSEGSNVEVSSSTSTGGTIEITFESVTSSADQLTITENSDINDYVDLFDSIVQDSGKILLLVSSDDGSGDSGIEYTTVGSIFEIDLPADLNYTGNIWVTIHYDEADILAAGGDENDIRMLHYFDGGAGGEPSRQPILNEDVNATGWEDVTASIDTENNTISGYLGSLSPIALAVTKDNTFGEAYFAINPLAKILVSDSSWALPTSGVVIAPESEKSIKTGQQVSISSSIENIQRNNQEFVFLVQVLDDQDIVHSINWQTGVLEIGQDNDMSVVWTPEEIGRYTVKIMVWDSLDGVPSALSTVTIMNIQVNE